ncbi:MAG: PKD domain-containing protein, partial [Candidatus Kaelpia aquatica]|nr:PKD domain-containing protein [Candidatus Kaelpia aquatica]
LIFTVTASDEDVATLSYSVTGLPSALISDSGEFSWTSAIGDVGDHSATITVTDSGNLTASEEITITVNAAPVIDIIAVNPFSSQPDLVAENTINFQASAHDTHGGSIDKYSWDFGDGDIIEGGKFIGHSYAASGSYEVTLTVTDNHGGEDNMSKTIEVLPKDIDIDVVNMRVERVGPILVNIKDGTLCGVEESDCTAIGIDYTISVDAQKYWITGENGWRYGAAQEMFNQGGIYQCRLGASTDGSRYPDGVRIRVNVEAQWKPAANSAYHTRRKTSYQTISFSGQVVTFVEGGEKIITFLASEFTE